MITGLVCLIAANVALLLAARRATRYVASGRPHLDLLIFLLTRLTLMSAIVMVGGLVHLLDPIGLLTLSCVVLLLAGAERPGLPRLHVPRSRDAGTWMLAAAGVIVLARLLLQVWFFAPFAGDALSYHLPQMAEWVRAGRFTRELGVDSQAPFPAGFQLIEAWWVVFLHHDVIIEMAGVEFLVLAAAAAFALARHLQLSERWSAFVALAFALTPGLYLQATSELNDLAVAALVVSAAALIVLEAPTLLVLLPIGLGIGTKGTFLFDLPGLAVLWATGSRPALRGTPARIAMALAAVAAGIGSFWYARNAIWYGNPLQPMTMRGVVEPNGYAMIRFGPSVAGALENLRVFFFDRLGDGAAAYTVLSSHVSGWGALPFACGIPAMLVAFPRNPSFRRLTLGLTVSAATVLLFVKTDAWFARFIIFFAVVPVLATMLLAARDRVVLVLAMSALMLQFASTIVPADLPWPQVVQLARQPWRTRTTALLYDADLGGFDQAIGYYADDFGPAYWCYGPGYSRRVAYLRATGAPALVHEMRNAGVRVLYASPNTIADQKMLDKAVGSGLLVRIRSQIYALPGE